MFYISDYEGDHGSDKCSVFGIDKNEYDIISKRFQIVPTFFSEKYVDRYIVPCNPWIVMRILGENFGYHLTVTPMNGRIESQSGERRTCIWTMVSSKKAAKSFSD